MVNLQVSNVALTPKRPRPSTRESLQLAHKVAN